MKNLLTLVLALSFGVVAVNAAWAPEDYTAYKTAKDAANTAEDAEDFTTAAAEYKKAVELAEKSGVKTSHYWRLNNVAYVLIKDFKKKVDYTTQVSKIESMSASDEKFALQQEVAQSFQSNIGLLDEANGHLETAKGLEAEGVTLDKITSNQSFVTWVKSFVDENLSTAAPAASAGTASAPESTPAPEATPAPNKN